MTTYNRINILDGWSYARASRISIQDARGRQKIQEWFESNELDVGFLDAGYDGYPRNCTYIVYETSEKKKVWESEFLLWLRQNQMGKLV